MMTITQNIGQRLLLMTFLISNFVFSQWTPTQFFDLESADVTPTSISFNRAGTILAAGFERSLSFDGRVIVYIEENGQWLPLGDPIIGDVMDGQFGGEVDLNAEGNRLLVSHRATRDINDDTGGYKAYELQNNSWVQIGETLEFPESTKSNTFSESMDISDSGDRIVVTYGFDAIRAIVTANVEVYDFIDDEWQQVGSTLTGEVFNDFFGSSVALSGSGDRLIVGASGDKDGEFGAPVDAYVKIYDLIDNDWVERARIANEDNVIFAEAPVAISEDGNIISISSNNSSLLSFGPFEYKTRVFETTDGENWTQKGNDIISPFDSESYARREIELNDEGTRLAIAYSNRLGDRTFGLSGQLRVLEFQNNAWELVDEPINGNTDVGLLYGESVALNGVGDRVGVVNFGWKTGNSGGVIEIYDNTNILSIKDQLTDGFNLYPNPSVDHLTITFDNLLKSGTVSIRDINGRIVYDSKIKNTSQVFIDHQLVSGIYLLNIEQTGVGINNMVRKLVVD